MMCCRGHPPGHPTQKLRTCVIPGVECPPPQPEPSFISSPIPECPHPPPTCARSRQRSPTRGALAGGGARPAPTTLSPPEPPAPAAAAASASTTAAKTISSAAIAFPRAASTPVRGSGPPLSPPSSEPGASTGEDHQVSRLWRRETEERLDRAWWL